MSESSANVGASLSIKTRTYMSSHFIQAAALFARQAAGIESDFKADPARADFAEHRGHVLAAIVSATAFLEATINELFCDSEESFKDHYSGLDDDAFFRLGQMWRLEVPKSARFRITQKFEIALAICEASPFDRGAGPYQDVAALVSLRNMLIHYEPTWRPAGSEAEHGERDFERFLRSRFDLNPLVAAGNPFYPDKCLSHGCCAWAVRSALAFTDTFFERLGLAKTPYDHLRSRLITS